MNPDNLTPSINSQDEHQIPPQPQYHCAESTNAVAFPALENDPETASATELFFRPVTAAGQALTVVCLLALLGQIPLLKGMFWFLAPLGLKYLLIPVLVLIATAMVIAYKARMNLFFEFLTGCTFPLTALTGFVRPMPYIALGDSLSHRFKFLEAAQCYAKAARIKSSLKVITEEFYLQRDYLLALMNSGDLERACDYAERWLAHGLYLSSVVDSSQAAIYSAHSCLITSLFYTCIGDLEKATEISHTSYEKFKDQPVNSEARHYANLAYSDFLLRNGRYAEAKPLLEEFMTKGILCPKIVWSDTIKAMASTNLALACAHTGDCKRAEKYLTDGARQSINTPFLELANLEAKVNIALLRRRDQEAVDYIDRYLRHLSPRALRITYLTKRLANLIQNLPFEAIQLKQSFAALMPPQPEVESAHGHALSTTTNQLILDSHKNVTVTKSSAKTAESSNERANELAQAWAKTRSPVGVALIYTLFQKPDTGNTIFLLALWAILVVFFLWMLRAYKKASANRATITSGKRVDAKIQMKMLSVRILSNDGSAQAATLVNSEEFIELSKLIGEKPVVATIYYDASDKPLALNVCGFYSGLFIPRS